jgi:hypothetical protein
MQHTLLEREALFASPQFTVHNGNGIMVVCMLLHIIKFVHGFPCQGDVKHFSHDEIMTGRCLLKSAVALSFGVYCQVPENIQPRNSLSPWTQAAFLVGSLGNLTGGC